MIEILLSIFMFGLVVWRISSLFVREEGPYLIFVKFRKYIGVYYDERSELNGKNVIAKAFICVWCLSFWVSLIVVAPFMYLWEMPVVLYIIVSIASSAVAIIIEEIIEYLGCTNGVRRN